MDDNAIAALVNLLRSTTLVNVSCQREYSPPIVEVDLPFGLSVTFSYDTYEQIREAAGLPEGICQDNDQS